MLKEEFDKIVSKINPNIEVTSEQYSKIEYVYAYHPSINNIDGKYQIAHIYAYGGMMVINDMCKRAKLMEDLLDEITSVQDDLNNLFKQKAFLEDPSHEV